MKSHRWHLSIRWGRRLNQRERPWLRIEYPGSLKLMDWQKARAYSQELRIINQWIHNCVCSLVTRQVSKICCKRLQLLMCLESSDKQHQTRCSTTCPQQASSQGQDHWNHYQDKYLKTRITKYQEGLFLQNCDFSYRVRTVCGEMSSVKDWKKRVLLKEQTWI